ncbi:hypothetical protein HY041_00190 [Candidatus Roizmanbacteria bacterium]|nr:hypothetical protein [Candidatus Roizmanbacteria bacterium]
MSKPSVIKFIIFIIIISLAAGGIAFYIFQPKKTISPISLKPQENKTIVAFLKQPSKTLKVYKDDSGFSFKYSEDLQVNKIDTTDPAAYANLEITATQTKGNIKIEIADTKLKSVDDWFGESKLSSTTNKKEIKIGEIIGSQMQTENKILAAAINQNILFTIEVDLQNQKYWNDVYDTLLSSVNFVPQPSSNVSETQPSDNVSDVTLEEETVE